MPPFNRRRYGYRRWWNYRKPRTYFRRRRFGKSIFRRKRRHRRVRRKKFYKRTRKLKTIKIQQWQPSSIKKCRITGYLCLFQAGPGRYLNNYTLWKESFFPEHYPGGGGWSIQQLSLGNLFTQHKEYMNYWTRSNVRMNMCRYYGCSIQLFREPTTDYVFTYMPDLPKTVNNLFYCSFHPIRLLTHNRKKIIPSFKTQPHKRKPYKTIFIPPPKLMKTQWFFQQQLSDFPLITFATSAISLSGMFGGCKTISNNVTFFSLDTDQMPSPLFQYKDSTPPQWGYQHGTQYLYGILQPHTIFTQNTYGSLIYLGNTMPQQEGTHLALYTNNPQSYKKDDWGNPFYWEFLSGNAALVQLTDPPTTAITKSTKNLQASMEKKTHYVFKARYNPFHDKGTGNSIYLIPNYDRNKTTWDPTSDPDLKWDNLPIWLVLWGLEDIVKRIGKCHNLDMDWTLVIRSRYIVPPQKNYVPLSYDFIHGRGPYDTEKEFMTTDDLTNWYPRFKYQRQPISNLVQSGPAVATGDNCPNIQAKIKYNFFFKWGGISEPQETIFDPNSQPLTPTPNNFNFIHEITDPASDITKEIYPWDFRRHFLTESATQRITESEIDDQFMFTDGRQTSTDIPFLQTEAQKKETEKTQTETLLQQLNHLQQYNQQLQQRLRNLKQLSMDP
nr:MAG: ORF1 [TTV-like mini virus]